MPKKDTNICLTKVETTAVSNVFNTTELLERILAKLHPFDLAKAARVCAHWQEMVASSKKLQRALFLLPVKDTLAYYHPDDPATDPYTSLSNHSTGIWSSSPHEIVPIRVFVNPLAQARMAMFVPGAAQTTAANTNVVTLARPENVPDFFGKAWQRMLFTQPPMGNVTLRWRNTFGVSGSDEDPTVTYDAEDAVHKGVSMVQMNRLAAEMLGEGVMVEGILGMERLRCAEELEI